MTLALPDGVDPLWVAAGAAAFVLLILLLILPIPVFLMDVLLAVSLVSSVLILMTAVMMKKISRLMTKSSIGARSMPWDDSPWSCTRRLKRMARATTCLLRVRFHGPRASGAHAPGKDP